MIKSQSKVWGGGKVSICLLGKFSKKLRSEEEVRCLLGKFSDFRSLMHYFTALVATGL